MGRAAICMIGEVYAHLTVLERLPIQNARTARWLCQCICGTLLAANRTNLRHGQIKSCGCMHLPKGRTPTHGHRRGGSSREYRSWMGMRARCNNPNSPDWKWYGAVGVIICERWNSSFANFLSDMGPRPPKRSLDRIDPFGDYEPGNCRWATTKEQAANKRNSLTRRRRSLPLPTTIP